MASTDAGKPVVLEPGLPKDLNTEQQIEPASGADNGAGGRWESFRLPGATKLTQSRASRALAWAVMLAFTLGFTYLSLRHVRFDEAWRGLKSSTWAWLLPSFAAFLLSTGLRAVRWRSLFTPGRRPPLLEVGNAMMVGYLFNNILPARAGEAARVVTLNLRARTPAPEIIGTVVVERAYDVIALLLILFVARPWLPHVSWLDTASTIGIVLAAIGIAVIVVLAVYGDRPVHFVLRPLARLPLLSVERVERGVHELVEGLAGLRRVRVALVAFGWTIAAWLTGALSAWLVTLAFHLHVPFGAGVLAIVAIGLAMGLPATPAAVGVFEAAALLALHAYGISQSRALPYALVMHLLNFIPFVAVGLALLHYNTRHPPAPRRPKPEPAAAD